MTGGLSVGMTLSHYRALWRTATRISSRSERRRTFRFLATTARRKAAARAQRTLTAQLHMENLYPLRKDPPCPTS